MPEVVYRDLGANGVPLVTPTDDAFAVRHRRIRDSCWFPVPEIQDGEPAAILVNLTDQTILAFAVIWRYHVRPEHAEEFERRYGPAGDWARLFVQSLRDENTRFYRSSKSLKYCETNCALTRSRLSANLSRSRAMFASSCVLTFARRLRSVISVR